MMSLLLAANESSAEKESDTTICNFFSVKMPFFITLLLFIIVCAVLVVIFFKIHETAGGVAGSTAILAYLGGLISEFSAGHKGHGIIMIVVISIPIILAVIGLNYDEGNESKQKNENKAVVAKTAKIPQYETITEEDLKKVESNGKNEEATFKNAAPVKVYHIEDNKQSAEKFYPYPFSKGEFVIEDKVLKKGKPDNNGECIIPDCVKTIGLKAFYECESLKSLTIPDSVDSIEKEAFYGCTNLTNIIIPKSVNRFREEAFDRTPWLEAKRRENPLVIINNILIDGKTCSGNVIVPYGVTKIGFGAFEGCINLESITLPDSLEAFSGKPFDQCPNLTIIGHKKSLAVDYAKAENIKYQIIR